MKWAIRIVVAVVVIGIVSMVAVGMYLGPIVTKAVNTLGPRVTGTPVTLESAQISLVRGSAAFNELLIGNPKGFTGDTAIRIGSLQARIAPASVIGDTLHVKEVIVRAPLIVYERKLVGGSNIDALLRQIEAASGEAAPAASAPAPEQPGSAQKFIVDHFEIRDATMSLILAGQTLSVPLPPLVIRDLGVREGGIPADQVASAVIRQLLGQLVSAAAEAGAGAVNRGAEGVRDGLNRLLGR
jgi:hypothetical protein